MSVTTETAIPSIQLNSVVRRKQRTLWGDAWMQFRKNKLSMFGLAVLTVLVAIIAFLPLGYTVDPEYINIVDAEHPPSIAHPLGTDDIGRDMLARNLFGGRVSMAVGVVAMAIAIWGRNCDRFAIGLFPGFR